MLPKKNVERHKCLTKDGYQLQEYKAIHEDNFPSGWLREDMEGKEKNGEGGLTKTNKKKVKVGKRGGERRRKGRNRKNVRELGSSGVSDQRLSGRVMGFLGAFWSVRVRCLRL